MKSQIFIRVDASSEMGMGHLIRCSALAQMLYEKYHIIFVCKNYPDNSTTEIVNLGIEVVKIDVEADFFQALRPGHIVVLDGYHFDISYQMQIKNRGSYLIYIDDFCQQEQVADLIINHAPLVNKEIYNALPSTKFALGLDYALIRPVFLQFARQQAKIPDNSEIFLCFGGSDYKNLTMSTLNVILEYSRFKKINVVTGLGYLYKEKLSNSVSKDLRIRHHHAISAEGICKLISCCSTAIVPASGILYEVSAVGCKIISGFYTDNQLGIYKGFRTLNGFVDAHDFNETALLKALDEIDNFIPIRLLDGNSQDRILQKINSLQDVGPNFSR
jgi:UDP-2,4-diacetamido-2,4,6-trideoxy-beta-L-altropyranose hydrolase